MQLPGEFSPLIEKKWFFAEWSGGLPLPTPLVVRPLKKTLFFMCVFPNGLGGPIENKTIIRIIIWIHFDKCWLH